LDRGGRHDPTMASTRCSRRKREVRSGFCFSRASVSDLTHTTGALWCGGVVPPSLAPTGRPRSIAGRGLFSRARRWRSRAMSTRGNAGDDNWFAVWKEEAIVA
jgi:hypothetical protein